MLLVGGLLLVGKLLLLVVLLIEFLSSSRFLLLASQDLSLFGFLVMDGVLSFVS